MIQTTYNPFYRCENGHTWKSTPITIVESDNMELPDCPDCGAALRVLGFLEALAAEYQIEADGKEVPRDASIAAAIQQDGPAEFDRQMKAAVSNWRIQGRDQGAA